VERDALQAGGPPLEQLGGGTELLGRHAVAAHRGQPLEHDPGVRVAVEQDHEVGEAADGVDHPAGREVLGGDLARRAPRGQDHQVAGEALDDLGQLVVGADREGVDAEPVGLAGQAAETEAVAVALGDRRQPGVGVGDLTEVLPPTVAVDGQRQAHEARRGISERRFM
jgi:hypothetical protein